MSDATEGGTGPLRLRVGRKVGRTLYRLNPDGSEDLIGVVDTRELAAEIVAAVNAVGDDEETR